MPFDIFRRVSSRFTFLNQLTLFFFLILGGLTTVSVLFIQNNKAFDKSAAQVAHTRSVLSCTDSLLILSQNLQWEARNFNLSSDSSSYNSYVVFRELLKEKVPSLKQLVSDNKYQYASATALERKLEQLINFTDSSLAIKSSTLNTSAFIQNVKQHIVLHEAIGSQIQHIKSEENRLLANRRAEVLSTVDKTSRIFVAAGVLILTLLAGTFIFVLYHFRKRRDAEKKVSESEHRFQMLINSTQDLAMYLIDDKGVIVDWYKGAEKIKGYTKEEVIGKRTSIFYTPEDINDGEPERNLINAAKQGSFETEGWRLRKDGSRFWADVLISAIYDQNGDVTGFTKVTRDFSAHKKSEDDARILLEKEKKLNEMKSSFVSMASHEFRTPLSTILSSVSLLESYKTTETQANRDKHIQRIRSSVKELVTTLEEFLSLEKIEEGKIHIKREMFNLRHLAQQMQQKFNPILKAGQAIEYNHSGTEDVFLDHAFITHILNNVLSNAVKYSPERAQIMFKTQIDPAGCRIMIKDHGIGISKADQQYLFQRFFRASNADGIKGTGLGLHIVKRFVDLLDGQIYVESELNEGTEFVILFRPPSD